MVATDKTCPLSTAQVRSNFLESMIESKNLKLLFARLEFYIMLFKERTSSSLVQLVPGNRIC